MPSSRRYAGKGEKGERATRVKSSAIQFHEDGKQGSSTAASVDEEQTLGGKDSIRS